MNLQERIKLLGQLGNYLLNDSPELLEIKQKAEWENPWFTQEFINLSIKNIAEKFLPKEKLEAWVKKYNLADENPQQKNIGIVMAGNIPLVGFHDLLSVFVSGHKATIKPSSKDDVLIKHIAEKLNEWNPETIALIEFAENLKGCGAYITTGSNNSSRYFEYYFGKYPNIIRRNRSSVAVLTGNETKEELELLADDIQLYYGLGCRNVSKIYVPEGYDFIPLLEALKKYNHFADFHKYRNNYDYQLALLMMNSKFYMTEGSVILTEDESIFSAVSKVNYEFYNDDVSLKEKLEANKDVQCIAGHGFITFGHTQSPGLYDYADGVDTMEFLTGIL